MICPNCKGEIPDGSKFCGRCGTKITINQEAKMEQVQPARPIPPPTLELPIKQPKRKKKMSREKKILVGETLILVIVCLTFYLIGKKLSSPETLLHIYADAQANQEWDKAYACLDITTDSFINPDIYKMVMKEQADADEGIADYQVIVNGRTKLESGKEIKDAVIQYRYLKSKTTDKKEVTLVKTNDRQFLFFYKWKIMANDQMVEDYSILTDHGASVMLSGVPLDDKYLKSMGNGDIYVIPSLFAGTYQIKIAGKSDIYEPIDAKIEVSNDAPPFDGTLSYSEKSVAQAAEAGRTAVQLVYAAALAEDELSNEILDRFTENGQAYAASMYNRMRGYFNGYSISSLSVTATIVDSFLSDEGTSVIADIEANMHYTYNYNYNYDSYWYYNDGKSHTDDDTKQEYLIMVYQNGKWLVDRRRYE